MARPKKDQAPDLKVAHELSVGLIERLTCPPGVPKAFLRDKDVTGLRVRVTASGAKSFVYEAKLLGKAISRTLGAVSLMSITEAKIQARELARIVKNNKQDPRELERQEVAEKVAINTASSAQMEADRVKAMTVGDIWPRYLQEGKPKRKDAWKPSYRASLDTMSTPGGVKKKRGKGLTRPGPIFPLLSLKLGEVTEDVLQMWFERESVAGKHQATRALMMFRGFLRWCSARPEYRKLIDRDAGKAPAILENLPPNTKRTDALQSAQIKGWWAAAEQLGNRTASVYLRALLLTGARREELASLTWANVDFRWKKLTLADKVDETRTIPLTPYLARLLATLPRAKDAEDKANPFVFASTGKKGRIVDVRSSLETVLSESGIDYLTFHGLRRSFTQRARAVVPAGAAAQIQGHKPSATADGYDILALDELRPYAERIETWILEQAGIKFDAKAEPGKLQLVVGTI